MFDGLAFDVGPLAQDVGGAAEVGVRRRHVAQALVVAGMGAIRTTLEETIAIAAPQRCGASLGRPRNRHRASQDQLG